MKRAAHIPALCWGDPSHSPVLLCHGRLDSCSSFRPLVQRLPRAHFYVSVDLPGNGRSDHYPRGASLNVVDYVPPIERIRDHFKWEKYTYIGHSLGAAIGKYLNHLYPGQITRMVDVDPEPLYTFPAKDLPRWYKYYCCAAFCGSENSHKLHAGPETAPKYTYEEPKTPTLGIFASENIEKHPLIRLLSFALDDNGLETRKLPTCNHRRRP
ncbi:hypothetical protein evm_014406 [Chilo suppressalis]|nr:hypothetical protein evm_014406 [Chilo suppressalis]